MAANESQMKVECYKFSEVNCIPSVFYTCFTKKNYTKTIIRLRLSDYGEYSPRLRLGEYLPITTSPSANDC